MKTEPVFVEADVKREQIRNKAVEGIKNAFPFVGNRFTVDVKNVKVHPIDVSPVAHKNALLHARTLSEPVRGTLVLKDNSTGKVVQELPKFNLLQLPYFTGHHTFVINGNSYNVSNQLRMKPGIYTRKRKNEALEAAFNLSKGDNFKMSMDQEKGLFNLEYGTTKIPLYPVLNKLGVSDKEMSKYWKPELVDVNRRAFGSSADRHISRLYNKMIRPAYRVDNEDRVAAIKNVYAGTSMDPHVTERTLGKRFSSVTPEAMLSASDKLLRAYKDDVDFDERDDLAYKHLKSSDDFIAERIKLEARGLKNKVLSKIERGKQQLEAVPASPFTKSVRSFLSTSALSSSPDQINPVEILDSSVRVTSLGEGGISSERAIPMEARRLHTSHAAVLDPIRTPESSRSGIDLRTTLYTGRGEDGSLFTRLWDTKHKRLAWVPVEKAVSNAIAFPQQHVTGARGKVDVIHNNAIQSMPASQVRYKIPNMASMYSPASNLIPFMDSIDGNRQTMASKMNTQALPLVHSETPLIQVQGHMGGRSDSMEREIGALVSPRAPVSGVVSSIRDGYIHIRPNDKTAAVGDSLKVPFHENFPLASKTFLHHNLLVKAGDEVKAGQTLADSAYTKDGSLTLGTNLNVAYIPMRGMNSNDAIVVSEGAAKKLTSQHMYRIGEDLDANMAADTSKHKSYFGSKYSKDMYAKLDDGGIIKPGMQVNKGDLLIASVRKTELSPEAQMLGKLHKSLVKPFRDAGTTWDKDYPGEVVDVAKSGRKIRLTVKMNAPLGIGDKISGRMGDKGVVSAIVPDNQMIQDENGNPIDVAISPATVVSRINPGQVLEAALGRVARKTGNPILVDNFSGKNNVQWVKDELKKNGLKDTETIFDPVSGKKIPKVLVGPRYMYKLFKSTDTNFSARGVEDYDVNQQPSSGGPTGAKSVGRLVFNALLAHDSRNILRESAALKSQKNDEWWRAYQLGLPLPPLKTTFAYDKFGAMLAGAGVKMDKNANQISVGPLTDLDTTKMSSGTVRNPLFVRAKDLRPEKGGLFDPVITGGTSGTKWSHFDLHEPIVSPTMERPVKWLLGMKQSEFDQTMRDEGGTGFKKRLSKLDMKKEEDSLLERMKKLQGTARDSAVKKLKVIRNLNANQVRPETAFIVKKVPVVPPSFRPILPGKQGDLQINDANYLYRDAMLANDMLKKSKDMPTAVQGEARAHLYDSMRALYGDADPVSPQLKARGVQGFLSRLAGTGSGPKYGFVHSKLLAKRQDLSGRGTIAPDPTLGMDEIGLPEDMAWSMYRPHITRGLVQRGYKAMDARKMIDDRQPVALNVLTNEIRTRPVLVNRAPSLYRYNMLAAYPKMVPGKTIRVHEMLAPIMSGDFDGDAVQIHLPATQEAAEDARKMTLPNMLLSDQEKFTLSKAAPQQEAIAGVYAATTAKKTGKKQTFANKADAWAAYNRGDITLGTPVEIKK